MRRVVVRIESAFDAAFGPAANPLLQLGALGWFFYWIVIASGIYLYIFFDTGVSDAYASVERITHAQWYAGGVMRSLHRYASDALVVVMLAHLVREWAMDRLRGPRWFAWVTGIVLIWFVFAAGITGYWVVWDRLAQYVAISTSEWLDALGIFGQPIARNFVHPSTLSGRFFTLMVFIHIAVPLIMLLLMWIHIQRLSRPRVNPPRRLALGTLIALVALSLVKPALSQGPADLTQVPLDVGLDWYYLAPLPLKDTIGPLNAWLIAGGATVLLIALAWLPPRRQPPAAVVNLEQCNGCARCAVDCPYSAISMQPRSDAAPFQLEAAVRAELCVSCGLCVGACPTATPFRRRSALAAGIELPQLPVVDLRERCLALAAGLSAPQRVLVFGCSHGVPLEPLAGAGVAVMELPCIGMLPPSFLDLLITRRHVDGVLLTGCREGGCQQRLGIEWTRGRIAGERDPHLRERVPRVRLAMFFAGRDGVEPTRAALERFAAALARAEDLATEPREPAGAANG